MLVRVRPLLTLARGLALAAGFFLASGALADRIILKDGTSIDGVIARETDTFIQIKVRTGGIETIKIVQRSEIKSIEKDAPATTPAPATAPKTAPATGTAPASATPPATPPAAQTPPPAASTPNKRAVERARAIDATVSRVAILNFGAPSSWGGPIDDTIGVQVNAHCWRRILPLLDKDRVSVVVVRVNSGGGSLAEVEPFHQLFENVYKRKYRTVAWIESSISAAAMSPWPLEEIYFMPHGNMGACTAYSGDLEAVQGSELERYLIMMEKASAMANRPSCIMRSMQIQEPLSASIDEKTGIVTWFQDTTGQFILNRVGQIYTMTASEAVKFKFAKGIAANREELVKLMGLNEVEWAGEEASNFVDEHMRAADKAEKEWQLHYRDFANYISYAQQSSDRDDRGKLVGKARAALKRLRALYEVNPNHGLGRGITKQWFDSREEMMRKLLQD